MIDETPGWLEVSAVNGPSSTVVSGDYDAVVAASRLAQQRGTFAHQLSVDYPGHTSALRPLRSDLAELLPKSAFQDGAGEIRQLGLWRRGWRRRRLLPLLVRKPLQHGAFRPGSGGRAEGRSRHVRRVVRAPLVVVSARRTGRRGVGGHRRVGASRGAHCRCAVGKYRRRRDRRSRLPMDRYAARR